LQGTCAVGTEPGGRFRARARLRREYARAQQGKLGIVTAVQRKCVNAALVHQLANFRGFGFELLGLASDRDHFRRHAKVKLQVHGNAILNVHLHRAGHRLLESLLLDGDSVSPDPERTGDILALGIGGELQMHATIDVGHSDLGARNHGTAWVADQAYNGSGIFLRP